MNPDSEVSAGAAREPLADSRPARVNAVVAMLFVAAGILVIVAILADSDDRLSYVAGIAMVTAMAAVIATPAISLAVLAVARPMHIGRETRVTGRLSAIVVAFVGWTLLRESLYSAATWTFSAGLGIVAFAVWVFTRSWLLPPAAREAPRAFSASRLLFTLAALFVVAVGWLTSAFARSYDKAYVTAMKSDLRNVVPVQQAFRDSLGRFASFLELRAMHKASTGVHLAMSADSTAWRAVTVHDRVRIECTAWAGRRPAEPRFAGDEGEPYCREP